jgi:hypothetical protein
VDKGKILYGTKVYIGHLLSQRNNTKKLNDMNGILKGQLIVEKILIDFQLLIFVTDLY